MIYQIWTATCC